MLLIWSILLWQDLKIQAPSDWESLARPWMSEAEERLYDQLAPSDQMLFRGFFVARRLQNPALWPETGLYAPGFHCDKKYGDIRDQIMFAIGEPLSVVVRGSVSSTPAKWVYSAFSLEFITLDGSHVGLAKTSQSTWEKIKQDQIQHPELRYDFREKSFGRTRLPEETHFSQVAVQSCFQVPHQNGAMIRVVLPIPDSLKTFIQKSNVNPTQHMELLVQLKRADQVTDEGPGEFRHAGQSFNLLTAQELWFDVFVPAGFHQMELKAYSGYLSEGL